MSPELEEILELRGLVLELRNDVQRLTRLVVQDRLTAPATPARSGRRHERRDTLLSELARGTGLGVTKAAAVQVLLVLTGTCPPPEGMEDALAELRECGRLPTAWETIYRALTQ